MPALQNADFAKARIYGGPMNLCECWVDSQGDIQFCRLHGAAEEMLEALKLVVDGIHVESIYFDVKQLISKVEGDSK